jgi:septum formation protein
MTACQDTPRHLVLASASPRRVELLDQIGVTADIIHPADIDEMPAKTERPRLYVERIAREKALAVAVLYPDSHVLAADTVVAMGRRILGKPDDEAMAKTYLEQLSGRRHDVMTAVVLICPDGQVLFRLSHSKVRFMRLDNAMIATYLSGDEWQGKAGGYAIQGSAAIWVDWISGSYSGIVGLPLSETGRMLRHAGLLPIS